jgi:predicted transcriptional regulator
MMEIYYDILTGIEREKEASRPVKRTRVQQHSNLSYDKFSRYLQDMAQRGLVHLNPLSITEKGREFLHDYGRIRRFMSQIGAKLFESEPPGGYGPAEYVASLPPRQHSVLIYDDQDYADIVSARFLSEGLARDESCIYLTHEDPAIVQKKLQHLGLDISRGTSENRLRILPPSVIPKRPPESFEEVKRGVRDLTREMKPPFRIFGNFVRVTNPRELQAHLRIDELIHDRFDELGISLLAWYDLNTIPRSSQRKFVERIVERHSHVIYASDPSKAFGFDSSLLKLED